MSSIVIALLDYHFLSSPHYCLCSFINAVWLSSLLYKRATTMPAAPRMAGMAVAMAPLSEAFELALLAALLALLEALLADLEALLEALLMLLETLLETELAEEEAEEEADEAADEPEPVKLLMREPGMRY